MAFRINGEITLDGSMFRRGLQTAGAEATSFLKNFALGAVGVYGLEQAFHKTVDRADELINKARNIDMGVEQFQVLAQAAQNAGLEMDFITKAFEKFNATRENILNKGVGWQQQLLAMHRLGVSDDELKNGTAAENVMGAVSRSAKTMSPADITNDLRVAFGRGGADLFKFLETDFQALESKMKSMGSIMDTTTAIQLKQFRNEMQLISNVLTSSFAPVIIFIGKGLFQVVTLLGTFGTYLGSLIQDLAFLAIGNKAQKEAVRNGLSPGQEAQEYFNKQQDYFRALEEQAKAMAYAADHPRPFDTSKEIPSLETKAKRERQLSSDSLISTGNFLGAGRNSIGEVAQRHLEVAQKQLHEVTLTREILQKMSDSKYNSLGNPDVGDRIDWGD